MQRASPGQADASPDPANRGAGAPQDEHHRPPRATANWAEGGNRADPPALTRRSSSRRLWDDTAVDSSSTLDREAANCCSAANGGTAPERLTLLHLAERSQRPANPTTMSRLVPSTHKLPPVGTRFQSATRVSDDPSGYLQRAARATLRPRSVRNFLASIRAATVSSSARSRSLQR